MPSQENKLRLCLTAFLLLLCLRASAQPDDPNGGRRPAPRVPVHGIGWLIATGALVGGLAARWRPSGSRRPRAKGVIGALALLLLALTDTSAQERMTVFSGNWQDPATWSGGVIPTPANSTSVRILHTVTISAGVDVSIDNLVVDGARLIVSGGATLQVVDGDSTDMQLVDGGELEVRGTVVGHNGISLGGMSAGNSTFHEGSTYRHRASGEGSIPVAQWHPKSTFEITGIDRNLSMHAAAWEQPWGTVVYNCPAQGEFVEFRGLLKTIQGDFIISATNNSILRLSQGQSTNLTVGGDLIISGPSEVWFSQSGTCVLNVEGDFVFASTSGASSYFTTTGAASVTIGGNLVVDAEHRLRMASGSASGKTDLVVRGDVTILRGRLDAAGTGSGTVTFAGTTAQLVHIARDADTGFEGNVGFRISMGADVDLGTSLLGNTTGGDLIVDGTLRLGTLNETGAIQAGPEGNIQVAGAISFGPESQLIYKGSGTQYLSYGNLETQVHIRGPGAVVLTDIQFGGLNTGTSEFTAGTHSLFIRHDLESEGSLTHEGTIVMNGAGDQAVRAPDATVHSLIARQTAPGSIVLERKLHLRGTLSIESQGTQVIANGNLILLSSSELPGGTASIGPLTGGGAVVGDVVVQRFIAGATGDNYRYISTPVVDATVADLMDDIPVTGSFEGADQGGELPPDVPSLFYYSEEASDWIPFPATGAPQENPFESGRGYCLFNWNGTSDSNWDVTGTVHQGPVTLPVTYTPSDTTLMRGWNLVGNPYPSTIQWGAAGWDSVNISASIAVRDNLAGGFRYWDGEVGSLTDGLLASGQSFWVRATGESPYLQVMEDAKSTLGGEYYRRHAPDFVELSVSSKELSDRAYLRIRNGSSPELDGYDAPKMRNDSLSLSFLTTDGVGVAIHAVPDLEYPAQFPLEIREGAGRVLTFRVQGYGKFRDAGFALLDDATGTRYAFDDEGTVTLTGGLHQPLKLVVEAGAAWTVLASDHEPGGSRVLAFPVPAREYVFVRYPGIRGYESVQLYGPGGLLLRNVAATRDKDGCLVVNLSGLAAGSYFIRMPGKIIPNVIRILKVD